MTELKRWTEEGAPESIERMLHAAEAEQPSAASLANALASLGIAGAVASAASGAAATGTSGAVGNGAAANGAAGGAALSDGAALTAGTAGAVQGKHLDARAHGVAREVDRAG